MNKNLILKIETKFQEIFKGSPIMVASPGRINLIGEHTDYNKGHVLPAAIDKYIICALAKNHQQTTRIYSLDSNESYEIDLNNIGIQENGSWKNYVIGIIDGLIKLNARIENFDLVFGGDIPIGAGLSSSAALENCIVYGLNELFTLGLSKAKMIKISMQAEHEFAGVKCGIMDQFATMMGKYNQAILLNCDDLSFEYIPIEIENYALILINSNIKHQLANSAYNERKDECSEGLKHLQEQFPQLMSLAGVNLYQLNTLSKKMPPLIYNRCLYVIEENKRVLDVKKAIENKQWGKFGELLFESHHGLQHLYEVSCTELDFLVERAKTFNSVIGCRMMGGGFGGCTLNLIKKVDVEKFTKSITTDYHQKFGHSATIFAINTSDGTKIIECN